MIVPIIRRARSSDLPQASALLKSAVARMLALKIFQWDETYPSPRNLKTDQEKGELLVIEHTNEVAGFMTINQEYPPDYDAVEWRYPGKALVIHRLVVDPLLQGVGLGTRLMHFTEQEARKLNCAAVRLDTFSENLPALAFYEKLGYQKSGQVTFRKGVFFTFEKAV